MFKVFPFHRDFSPEPVELLTFYQLSACPDVQLGLLNHHFVLNFLPTLHRPAPCIAAAVFRLRSWNLQGCISVRLSNSRSDHQASESARRIRAEKEGFEPSRRY